VLETTEISERTVNIKITPLCVGLLMQESGGNFASYPATFLVEKEIKTVYIISINNMKFILFISVH
jgi:hypothetical protein